MEAEIYLTFEKVMVHLKPYYEHNDQVELRPLQQRNNFVLRELIRRIDKPAVKRAL